MKKEYFVHLMETMKNQTKMVAFVRRLSHDHLIQMSYALEDISRDAQERWKPVLTSSTVLN